MKKLNLHTEITRLFNGLVELGLTCNKEFELHIRRRYSKEISCITSDYRLCEIFRYKSGKVFQKFYDGYSATKCLDNILLAVSECEKAQEEKSYKTRLDSKGNLTEEGFYENNYIVDENDEK